MNVTTGTQKALEHLENYLERKHPGFASDARLHNEARALSIAYTTGATIGQDAAASTAYLAHFGPRAIVAVSHALSFCDPVRSAVDIGAGSGASALALCMQGVKRVILIERSTKASQEAQRLLEGLADVVVVNKNIEAARPDDRSELLLSAFTFGELPGTAQEAFARLARLGPAAHTTVLVDAGDRPRSRRIQELRDSLVTSGKNVRAPCPHKDRCPALLRERDWCHTRHDKNLPEKLARFARDVGRDDERMASAFLVLAKDAAPPAVLVIGDARKEKGRVRVPVCGPGDLRFVQGLKRHRDVHDTLLDLPRGARLPVELAANITDGTAYVEDLAALGELP